MERSGLQTAILNIVAIILAVLVLFIVNTILIIVFGVIVNIPFLGNILSWPSTPVLYALSGANIISIGIGGTVCHKICGVTKGGYRPGMLIYGLICIALFSMSAYGAFTEFGFCDAVICHIFGAIAGTWTIRGAKPDSTIA